MSIRQQSDRLPDLQRGVVPPGRYAHGGRSPIVWVLLCAYCAGFEVQTDEGYEGFLSGRCQGCDIWSRELHKFKAWIDTADGCGSSCEGRHPQAVGDIDALDRLEAERA